MTEMATPEGAGGEQTNAPYSREAALQLLREWTQSESLRKHALAVEACVVACGAAEADRLGLAGEDRTTFLRLYSTTALLHDFDYERHPTPEEHPFVGVDWSARAGLRNCGRRYLATRSIRECRGRRIWTRRCLPAMSWRAFHGLRAG